MSSNGISSLKQVHLSNEHQKQIFFSCSSSQESLTGKFTNLHISFDDWLITVDNNKKEKTAKSSFSEVMCQKWKLLLLQMMSQALLKKNMFFLFSSQKTVTFTQGWKKVPKENIITVIKAHSMIEKKRTFLPKKSEIDWKWEECVISGMWKRPPRV